MGIREGVCGRHWGFCGVSVTQDSMDMPDISPPTRHKRDKICVATRLRRKLPTPKLHHWTDASGHGSSLACVIACGLYVIRTTFPTFTGC